MQILKQQEEENLLPPRQKFECEECHKKFRKLNFCRDGKRRCGHCKNKRIKNKWYIPPEKRKDFGQHIGKFTITDREKNLLHKQFVQQGLDSTQAWRKVYQHMAMLKAMKRRKYGLWVIQRNRKLKEIKENEEAKKRFLEGLK